MVTPPSSARRASKAARRVGRSVNELAVELGDIVSGSALPRVEFESLIASGKGFWPVRKRVSRGMGPTGGKGPPPLSGAALSARRPPQPDCTTAFETDDCQRL